MGNSTSGWGGGGSSTSSWSEEFGVRQFVNLMLLALRFYDRHKSAIDLVVPVEVAAALSLLDSVSVQIQALNQPGPD